MPVQRLLTDQQHRRAHDAYMREMRSPTEVAAILNAEFESEGLKVTPKQITTYASEREWSKRRKAMKGKAEKQANRIIAQQAAAIVEQRKANLEKHQAFLEKSADIGAKVIKKAETLLDSASTGRELSSIANAAAKGIEIYRAAIGLDSSGGGNSMLVQNNYFNFARSEGSPFAKKVEPAPSSEESSVDVASGPVEDPASPPAAESEAPPAPAETPAPAASQSQKQIETEA